MKPQTPEEIDEIVEGIGGEAGVTASQSPSRCATFVGRVDHSEYDPS